ncbi:MAG: ABC transporter ATP-binding protein [Acidimicrobiia bacterium]|nr:ABC transporter ATP-binding protein [Acidimicrobiia bacterium]MDH5519744.1 ABC transporter ATP-binding protein [Acidimicrobiia bacterium]
MNPGLEANVKAGVAAFSLAAVLTAGTGTTVAVVGPNGSGKTTLLNVLAGVVPLSGGEIVVNGTVWDRPADGIRLTPEQRDLALVPQNALLFPHFTVVDNVAFGLRYRDRGLSRRVQRDQALAALEAAGLDHLADRKPNQLSGGQRQRVAIARAVVTRPSLLLLDEPLSNVDAANRHQLRETIDQLRPPGQIQIVVTHGRLHASTADQVVALDHGRVVATGTAEELGRQRKIGWLRDMLAPTD